MGKFRIPKAPRVKPKFTVKDFTDGVGRFEHNIANMFYEFVIKRFDNKIYDFKVIRDQISPSTPITKEGIKQGIEVSNGLVFISNGKYIDQVTYKELMTILEYGRKDKGILPQPLLRQCFEEFQPIYKSEFRKFLLNKKS